jgi:hypothetical protein
LPIKNVTSFTVLIHHPEINAIVGSLSDWHFLARVALLPGVLMRPQTHIAFAGQNG